MTYDPENPLRKRRSAQEYQAKKAARTSAQMKEWTLRSAIGPSSIAEQHYEKVVKALPPPPEREEDDE